VVFKTPGVGFVFVGRETLAETAQLTHQRSQKREKNKAL
jgi:hypothetical protein